MSLSRSPTPSHAEQARLRLPPDVTAPALARGAVLDLVGQLPTPLLAQLSLVASELVTNVLRHCAAADPSATLTLELAPDRVRLAVTDPGPGFDPHNRSFVSGPDGGWGLRILDAVADRWWVEQDRGTRVVCEIDR